MRGIGEVDLAATERRLLDAFTAAGETVTPGSIRGLPALADRPAWRRAGRLGAGQGRAGRGPRRASWLRDQVLVPLAAATAVALVAVSMTVVVPKLLAGGHPPAGPGGVQAQSYNRALGGPAPRYFVGVRLLGKGDSLAALVSVYSAVSGQVVASLSPPGHGRWFRAVATLGSDRTFVAAAGSGAGADGCHTWFYRFSITPRGQPVNVAELPAAAPGVVADSTALAGSANGQMVAYATRACTASPASRVGVIHLPTGKVTAWTAPSRPRSLSLSADGSLLSFVAKPGIGPAEAWTAGAPAAWILRTKARPGLLASRKALRAPGGVLAAALSPSGRLLFAITADGLPNRRNGKVAGYDAVTGAQVVRARVLAGGAGPPGISPAASGRFALVYLLRPGRVQELNLATGQQRSVPVAAADTPAAAAW